MDTKQRLELSKLIKEYESEETTGTIRSLKHSTEIKRNVGVIEGLKKKYSRMYKSNFEQFRNIAMKQADFLYNNYTNIFNRLIKNELDLHILWQFLEVLRNIEDGEIDQHEGSYQVGMLLKKLYVDSALKQDEKREKHKKKKNKKNKKNKQRIKNISWVDYKKTIDE